MASVSPTKTELNDAVRDYVALATGIDINNVIPGDDNAPAPLGLYCTVQYISSTIIGIDNRRFFDSQIEGDVTYNQRGTRSVQMSIQFYREGATDAAKALSMFHLTPVGRIYLSSSIFNYQLCENYSNINAVISTQYEERAALTYSIYVYDVLEQEVPRLDDVIVDTTVDYNNVQLNESITIERD